MKVYIVKVLVEDTDCNSCSVEVFNKLEDAKKFADEEIDIYAEEYEDSVVEKADLPYQMNTGDTWVTITIEEKEIH